MTGNLGKNFQPATDLIRHKVNAVEFRAAMPAQFGLFLTNPIREQHSNRRPSSVQEPIVAGGCVGNKKSFQYRHVHVSDVSWHRVDEQKVLSGEKILYQKQGSL